MATIHGFSRYGSVMGVFGEWHSTVWRLLRFITPTGAAGIAHIYDFAGKSMTEWYQRSETEKRSHSQDKQQEDSLQKNFLDSLLTKHRKTPDSFTIDDAYYHIVPNISAGGETTGIALSATIYFLCKNPTKMKKLREELETARNGNIRDRFTMKDTRDYPYLQAVMKESLRLFPATGLGLTRVIPKGGLTLAGYFFPEGVSLFSALFSLGPLSRRSLLRAPFNVEYVSGS